jgi:hypothetical protein
MAEVEVTVVAGIIEVPLPGESSVAQAARNAAATAAADVAADLAEDRAAAEASAVAAASSASAAAASVPATADRTVGRRPSDTAIWSMLRATEEFGFGPDGNLTTAPIDTLRWELDPATLAPLGAAFAGARTNRILWSRDLTQAAWRKVNATVALTATGAEGTSNAASIVTASAADAWVAQYGSASAAGSHGISIMARRRTGTGDVRFSLGQTTGGAAVGPVLLNQDFSSSTGWTLGAGWSITGGQLVGSGVGTGNVVTISLPGTMVAGLAYAITYTIVSITSGGVRPRFDTGGAVEAGPRSTAGTFTDVIRMNAGNTTFRIFPTAAGTNVVIDNLTIQPYLQLPTALTAQWQRFNLGLDTTTAGRPNPALGIYLASSGDEIDVDFAQGEAGPFTSAVIPVSTGTAGTRAQGNVSIPVAQLGARISRRQGLIILDWNSQPGPFTSALDAEWFGLVSWGDTTADNRLGILINPAHTSLQARVTAGGVVQTASAATISAPSAGLTTRAAVAWDLDAGFLQVAGRGVAGSKVALTALPATLTHLMPGRYATSNPGFLRVQGLEVRPAALFDSPLAALT